MDSFWPSPPARKSLVQNTEMAPTLLVVEDDDTIRETIRDALFIEGFEVLACGDGREALELLQRQGKPPYDLVVLDLMLPGMSGLDICRQLRASGDQTPILVVSARDHETDRVLGLEVGADDYLVKPFGMNWWLGPVP
jgi:two-component system phosphate regulon response regulator PhoB